MASGEKEETLLVGVLLKGDEVKRFLQFKEAATLTKNATAGRKLLVERLNELIPKQEAAPAAAGG